MAFRAGFFFNSGYDLRNSGLKEESLSMYAFYLQQIIANWNMETGTILQHTRASQP